MMPTSTLTTTRNNGEVGGKGYLVTLGREALCRETGNGKKNIVWEDKLTLSIKMFLLMFKTSTESITTLFCFNENPLEVQ